MELIPFAFLVAIVKVGICVPVETGEHTISDGSSPAQPSVLNSSLTVSNSSSNLTVFCNATNNNCNNASKVNTTQLPKNLSTSTVTVAVAVNVSSVCMSNGTENIAVYCDGSKLNLTKICGKSNGTNVLINCVNITQSLVNSGTSSSAKSNFTTSTNASNGTHTSTSNSAVINPTVSVAVATRELQATPVVVSSSVLQVEVSTSMLFSSPVHVSISPTITTSYRYPSTSQSTTAESTTSQSTTTESTTLQSTTAESTTSQSTTTESTTLQSTTTESTTSTSAESGSTNTQKPTVTTSGSTSKLTTVAPLTTENRKTTVKTVQKATENTPKATTLKMAGTSKEEVTMGTKESEGTTFRPTCEFFSNIASFVELLDLAA